MRAKNKQIRSSENTKSEEGIVIKLIIYQNRVDSRVYVFCDFFRSIVKRGSLIACDPILQFI